jgi:hypothetical protein
MRTSREYSSASAFLDPGAKPSAPVANVRRQVTSLVDARLRSGEIGRHRTGSMIAAYRMSQDGWTLDQAYNEMRGYDFYTGGGHGGFKKFDESCASQVAKH